MVQQPAIIRLINGDESPTVLAELRAGVLRWAAQTGDKPLHLERVLGLGGPRSVRAELRRMHLLRAAELLPGPKKWDRCRQLAEACRLFENRRWPAWRGQDEPPEHATDLDRVLWDARQHGELACSPENYLDLLSEK